MAVESLTNARENLPNVYSNITAREIDFVTMFGKNWDALMKILGIMRPIKKAPGSQLVSYTASVSLASGAVDPGNVIPYSKATVSKAALEDLTIEKYAKAVPIEDVAKYGAAIAVQKTDEAFKNELQSNVLTRFFNFLKTGTLTAAESSFQMGLAMARGLVIDKFNKMRRNVTNIVGFANVLDAYKYLGAANITVQNQFGMTYIENFMGYSTLFLMSDPDIPQNMIIALPVENIDLYYIDPNDSEFAQLGLSYTVQGETNLIGFHANGNYSTAVGESYALMGMKLWAEYLDGIAKITIDDSFLADLTVSAETDTFGVLYDGKKASDLQSDVTVSDGKIAGTLKYIEGGLDPSGTGPLAGSGNFLALKWTGGDMASKDTELWVGLEPSQGSGMVECLSDTDHNGVFKITDKVNQRVKFIQKDATHTNIQYFDLSGLTLLSE